MVWSAHIIGRFPDGPHGRQPDESTKERARAGGAGSAVLPDPVASEVANVLSTAVVMHKTLGQSMQHGGIASAPAISMLEHSIRDLWDGV